MSELIVRELRLRAFVQLGFLDVPRVPAVDPRLPGSAPDGHVQRPHRLLVRHSRRRQPMDGPIID